MSITLLGYRTGDEQGDGCVNLNLFIRLQSYTNSLNYAREGLICPLPALLPCWLLLLFYYPPFRLVLDGVLISVDWLKGKTLLLQCCDNIFNCCIHSLVLFYLLFNFTMQRYSINMQVLLFQVFCYGRSKSSFKTRFLYDAINYSGNFGV